MMHDPFASCVLLAVTVIALLSTRRRGLLVQIVVEALLVLIIGASLVWQGTAPLPPDGTLPAGLVGTWLRALAVIWWLIGARLIVNITMLARGRDPRSRDARLFSELIAAVIYITTVLIIFNSVLNLPVNGLLATSGVIAIVLGLALQNTLADVFSGIAVSLEKPFHLGDRVSLGNDVEGIVVQMNWRSIRIQTDGEDLVTIPNSIVAKGQIVNRSVPTSRRAASIEIVTPSTAVSGQVFDLLQQAALLCPDVLPDPGPTFTVQRSGLMSATYAAKFFVADTPKMISARSMMLRQVRRLFRYAGIGLAQPMSEVDLLGSIVLFEALSKEEVRALAAQLIPRTVEPGDVIFEQGVAGTSIYVVQAGVMETMRHAVASAREMLGRIGPGEYIGELGLITGASRGVTMTALTHGRVLELPGESLSELLRSNAALCVAMERSVRRGLALLDRDAGAREAQPEAQGHDFLARIKAFFTV